MGAPGISSDVVAANVSARFGTTILVILAIVGPCMYYSLLWMCTSDNLSKLEFGSGKVDEIVIESVMLIAGCHHRWLLCLLYSRLRSSPTVHNVGWILTGTKY